MNQTYMHEQDKNPVVQRSAITCQLLAAAVVLLAARQSVAQTAAAPRTAEPTTEWSGPAGDNREVEAPLVVPEHITWSRAVVLSIMWLFIAPILLGPIVLYFRKDAANDARISREYGGAEH